MDEFFLHFVWRFQYFNKQHLNIEDQKDVHVIRPGTVNNNAGPDFLDASIRIGDLMWHGHVEIHLKASDWYKHGHHEDEAYNNVVLHVVWENDDITRRSDGTAIHTISLKNKVSTEIYARYQQLVGGEHNIVCSPQLYTIDTLTAHSMFDKVLVERLQRKALDVLSELAKSQGDWEEVAYRTVARNFGFKINGDVFYTLSAGLPLKILRKHRDHLFQVEALLFGQAGFLAEIPVDDYQETLQKEYTFLAKKYALIPALSRFQWKFLRLRPANFPTIRIAQLAGLLHHMPNLFSAITDKHPKNFYGQVVSLEQSEYWGNHYDFGKKSKRKIKGVGLSSAENLMINSVVPVLAAYSIHIDNDEFMNTAIDLLQIISAEKNHIVSEWTKAGISIKSAFDSQAAIELRNNYCKSRRCLECNIGMKLIKPAE